MITTIIATHVAINNLHNINQMRGGGGGNNQEPDDDNLIFWVFAPFVMLGVLVLILILDAATSEHLPDYEVPGYVVGYSEARSGKVMKVFVHLRQHDGAVRVYNTEIKPQYCRYAPLNTQIPVIVTTNRSRILSHQAQHSNLKYNPCK